MPPIKNKNIKVETANKLLEQFNDLLIGDGITAGYKDIQKYRQRNKSNSCVFPTLFLKYDIDDFVRELIDKLVKDGHAAIIHPNKKEQKRQLLRIWTQVLGVRSIGGYRKLLEIGNRRINLANFNFAHDDRFHIGRILKYYPEGWNE